MTERPKSYIGVSGVVSVEQQHRLRQQFNELELADRRNLALGVKAVHKTQFLDIENKYGPEWFPVGEDAFTHALEPRGENMLRVAQVYFDADIVHDANYRTEFVQRLQRRGAAWLQAIQFDLLPWHEDLKTLDFIEQINSETGLKIVLQAHGGAMQELGPQGIARTLGKYASSLEYVLFDASHGKGLRMDAAALQPFLAAAYGSDELRSTGIAVAGGLNATVVCEDLPRLLSEYPDLSWDAEGQLHPTDSCGKRPINMNATMEYFAASAAVLRRV